MCGIFALVRPPNVPVSSTELRRACSLIHHRGPDQSGYALLHGGTVGFGHTRLSIQDPDAPPQPLVDEKTGTTIIFNGEVYDHLEIGRSLIEEYGITLPDSTDTAVVLALYILHGPTPEFFSRLNGEFAFIIWDSQRQHIIAVRDRFGIKPLCWYHDHDKLAFSSEIKAIASVSGLKKSFSAEWLDKIDPGFSIPTRLTFMEGVYNVLPGHYLTMDLSTSEWNPPKSTIYWSALPLLLSPRTPISYDEAKAEVRRLITAAVKRRLVADRELCVYLSGGVDSTVVCGVIRSLGHPLTCLTIGFGDHAVSEEDLAVKTAEHYSLPHERVTYTAADTVRDVERTLYHTEIPILNPHSIAKFRLSEFAHEKNFVVALTGEGSDELLLGYAPFKSDLLLEMESMGGKLAEKAERLRKNILSKEGYYFSTAMKPEDTPRVRGVPSWQAWNTRRLHMISDGIRAPNGRPPPVRSFDDFAATAPRGLSGVRMGQVEWLGKLHNYVIPCLGERVEMASAIEGRPPILDHTFAEFVLRLPQEYLLDPDTLREKKVLYDAFEDLLPPHIRTRTKHPFVAPPWFETLFVAEEGKKVKDKYLSSESLERTGVWSHQKLEKLLVELKGGAMELDSILGLVLSVQILHALFIEGEIIGDPDFPMVDRSPTQGYR